MDELVESLKEGEVAVIPTDTIYGLVGSALNPQTVEKIYTLRIRDKSKPLIVLISSIDNLKIFGIQLDPKSYQLLTKLWPNPVSVVLKCEDEKFEYLHRGTKSLAFRFPNNPELVKLLKQTGPLVAPSANLEGQKEAESIEEAKKYFGDKVKIYIDKGVIKASSSTLISLDNEGIKVIREGAFPSNKIPQIA